MMGEKHAIDLRERRYGQLGNCGSCYGLPAGG